MAPRHDLPRAASLPAPQSRQALDVAAWRHVPSALHWNTEERAQLDYRGSIDVAPRFVAEEKGRDIGAEQYRGSLDCMYVPIV